MPARPHGPRPSQGPAPAHPNAAPHSDPLGQGTPRTVSASAFNSIRARAGRFWFWLLAWNSVHCPWLVPMVTPFFVWSAWHCSRYTRLSTLANARRILGEGSSPQECRRVAKSALTNFFRFVGDMGRNSTRTTAELLADVGAVEGLDGYLAARAAKRGAILAAAHMGPFETAVAGLRQHEPLVHVVFRRDRNHVFESLRAALHKRLGIIEAPIDNPPEAMGPWLRLRDALRRNEVVLLQADRVMLGQRGVRVPFCSGHLELPPGPVKLALASGSPIIPVFSLWESSGRVRIIFEQPIEVTQGWTKNEIHPALLGIARAIEERVKQHPDQWLIYDPAFCEDQEPGR